MRTYTSQALFCLYRSVIIIIWIFLPFRVLLSLLQQTVLLVHLRTETQICLPGLISVEVICGAPLYVLG